MMSSRLAGDGPRRRSDHPHLADRAQDEGAARHAARRSGATRQLPRQALHRQVHDQPGDHARHRARGRLDRGRQARRSRAVEAGVLRRQAGADPEGRHDRRGADGRPERVDPDAAAGALPADVRRVRRRAATTRVDLRVAGRAAMRASRDALGLRKPLVAVQARADRQARHDAQRRYCRRSRSTRRPTRCAPTASC